METTYRRFPIGIQNFEQLRNNNCVYIDKTELIYKLTHTAFVCFLNRPPKFGKSLLTSTIEAYFLGKRKLFEGLAIEKLEKEWTEILLFVWPLIIMFRGMLKCCKWPLNHNYLYGKKIWD